MELGDGGEVIRVAKKRIEELESTVAALQEKIKVGEVIRVAKERIEELESTVQALQEKIKVAEMKNSQLVALLATFEESSSVSEIVPEVSGCKDMGLKAVTVLHGKVTGEKYCEKYVCTLSSETRSSNSSGDEMKNSFEDNAVDKLSTIHQSGDLHTTQHGLKIPPQDTCGAQNDSNSDIPLGLQIHCSASLTNGGGTIGNQVGQVSRKVKKGKVLASRSLENQFTKHVALRIMYLGSSYHGFAAQGVSHKTVESELFAALEHTKLLVGGRAEAKYSRCGRTDKGVSAIGQVIALELRSKRKSPPTQESGYVDFLQNDHADLDAAVLNKDRVAAARACRDLEESVSLQDGTDDEIDYVGVLNRVLPDDIRVLGWCPVPRDFNARFSCLYREYKYFFINSDLDIDAMKRAGSKFLGDHDFRNFCKMDASNVHNYRRTISNFDILPVNESWAGRQIWVIRIRGTAFLWHQIRCMAAVLFMVGQRHESPMIVEDLLNVGKVIRKPQYNMASELPLVLHTCGFQGLTLHCPSSHTEMALGVYILSVLIHSPLLCSGAAKHLQIHLNNIIERTIIQLVLLQDATSELPTSDLEEGISLKKQHTPLLGRLTEPSYEERRGKKSLIPMQTSSTSLDV